jgi:hypothetical protein
LAAGSYTFSARASDNANAKSDSSPVLVSVLANPPVAQLTSPKAGSLFNYPAAIPLVATASDPDGTIAKVEFFMGSMKLGTPQFAVQRWLACCQGVTR